jgi:hypothetical protein
MCLSGVDFCAAKMTKIRQSEDLNESRTNAETLRTLKKKTFYCVCEGEGYLKICSPVCVCVCVHFQKGHHREEKEQLKKF